MKTYKQEVLDLKELMLSHDMIKKLLPSRRRSELLAAIELELGDDSDHLNDDPNLPPPDYDTQKLDYYKQYSFYLESVLKQRCPDLSRDVLVRGFRKV
jgi:hypothetical protein